MGGTESKEEEDYFLLQNLNKIHLTRFKTVQHYWIDANINAQNAQNLAKFRQFFYMDQFTSTKVLRQELSLCGECEVVKVICAASLPDQEYQFMQNEKKIYQIILFCGHQPAAKKLMERFSKIKGYGLHMAGVLSQLKSLQASDNLAIPQDNMLFMIEQDTKSLNKYRLNYHCITNKQSKTKGKQDFIALAEKLYPQEKQAIEEFRKDYKVDWKEDERDKQIQLVFKWSFKSSFYWSLVENIPKTTTDPKQLAYLRLPFKDIYEAIFQKFHKEKRKYIETFIVTELNQKQKINLQKSTKNYVIFTSFIKGFTKEAEAIKQFKSRKNGFLFTIVANRKKCEQSLNFGYYINEQAQKQNIIYNIYNLFKVDEVSIKTSRATLVYGGLAQAFAKNQDPSNRTQMLPSEITLLRNYDYLEDMMKKVDSQATMLQLSGYFKQSLEIYDRKEDYLRKTNDSVESMNQCSILKGDAFRINGDYESAEKQYLSIKSDKLQPSALVHLAELYHLKGDQDKLQNVLDEIKPKLSQLKKLNQEDYFRAENYFAVKLMNNGKLEEAKRKFKKLRQQIIQFYDYRFEGRPLVHEIYRNIATCEAMLNNHQEALNLLNSTREWQMDSEGRSASVALTQTLIMSVNKSRGDSEKFEESRTRLSRLEEDIQAKQRKLLNQSLVRVDIQKSFGKINVNSSLVVVDLNPPKQPINIEQSAVNVEIPSNQPKNINIEQSAVNVTIPSNEKKINIQQSAVNIQIPQNPQPKPIIIDQSAVNVQI